MVDYLIYCRYCGKKLALGYKQCVHCGGLILRKSISKYPSSAIYDVHSHEYHEALHREKELHWKRILVKRGVKNFKDAPETESINYSDKVYEKVDIFISLKRDSFPSVDEELQNSDEDLQLRVEYLFGKIGIAPIPRFHITHSSNDNSHYFEINEYKIDLRNLFHDYFFLLAKDAPINYNLFHLIFYNDRDEYVPFHLERVSLIQDKILLLYIKRYYIMEYGSRYI